MQAAFKTVEFLISTEKQLRNCADNKKMEEQTIMLVGFIMFLIGCLLGVGIMCLMQVSGDADKRMQEYYKNEIEE